MKEEIVDIAGGNSVHARILEELLKQLKQGAGGDALAEMARDVLDGRIGLREAVADSYYVLRRRTRGADDRVHRLVRDPQ